MFGPRMMYGAVIFISTMLSVHFYVLLFQLVTTRLNQSIYSPWISSDYCTFPDQMCSFSHVPWLRALVIDGSLLPMFLLQVYINLLLFACRFGITRVPPWWRGVSCSNWWIHGSSIYSLAKCDCPGVFRID